MFSGHSGKDSCIQGEDCCVDEAGELIQKLVRTLQMFERATLTQRGFTFSQCYTMLNIYHNKFMSMNRLSEEMNLDKSTMSRIVSTLQRDKYLQRERSPEDGRVVIVRLTAKGEKAAEEIAQEIKEFYHSIITQIPKGEVEVVFASVKTLLGAFERVRPFCC